MAPQKRKKGARADGEPPDPEVEAILHRIRTSRNFDFHNYKRATLKRRIERRMAERGCHTVADYAALLDRDPAESGALISSMLIKVTSFFRDPEAWDILSTRVIQPLLAEKRPGEEIRVWCAGCATGEEAFTIAMLFAQAMGPAFQTADLKVFGTDADDRAIAAARHGVYTRDALDSVSKRTRELCFVEEGGGWQVRKDIRRAVVFGVNNLVSDAPISRLDLLICRNVFIYLDAVLQMRVLTRFHYALRRNGVLMLGKSELIPFAAKIFEPVDLARRIYRKNVRRDVTFGQERLVTLLEQDSSARNTDGNGEVTVTSQFHHSVLQSVSMPVITTSLDGTVMSWNSRAAMLWGRPESDVLGKKLASLLLPELSGELLVERTASVREGRSEMERGTGAVARPNDHRPVLVEIDVTPLRDGSPDVIGLVYSVRDTTSMRDLESDLRKASAERQGARDDLANLHEEMQSSNDELETTNEELQSANEELQTTNEELQSTNEELETTNEELQSTNSELDATNRELAARTEEMNTLAYFQRTIIRSLTSAVVVLGAHGRITMWNLAAERLLGLSEEEASGQVLWTLHVPALARSVLNKLRKAVSQNQPLRAEAIDYELPNGAKGRATMAAVPIGDEGRQLGSVIIFDDTTRMGLLAAEVDRLKAKHERQRRK